MHINVHVHILNKSGYSPCTIVTLVRGKNNEQERDRKKKQCAVLQTPISISTPQAVYIDPWVFCERNTILLSSPKQSVYSEDPISNFWPDSPTHKVVRWPGGNTAYCARWLNNQPIRPLDRGRHLECPAYPFAVDAGEHGVVRFVRFPRSVQNQGFAVPGLITTDQPIRRRKFVFVFALLWKHRHKKAMHNTLWVEDIYDPGYLTTYGRAFGASGAFAVSDIRPTIAKYLEVSGKPSSHPPVLQSTASK